MKDLLRTEHLSRADVDLLLDTAADFAIDAIEQLHDANRKCWVKVSSWFVSDDD